MKKIFLLFALAVHFVSIQAQEAKSLPPLSLSNIYGKKIDIDSYAKSGKLTLFSFWATWCSPCKKELTNMNDLYNKWKEKYNLQIVAVSIDDAKSINKMKSFLLGQKWKYDILLDANQDFKRALDISSVPFIVLADKNGKIVFTHAGYIEGDEYVLEQELQKLVGK